MALKEISKGNIRPIKDLSAGRVISWYASSPKDIKIDPSFIFEIQMNFGIGPNGEAVHKIRFMATSTGDLKRQNIFESTYRVKFDVVKGNEVELFVDDAGLAQIRS